MKEDELAGADNHLDEYLDSLITSMSGAMLTYPALAEEKLYIYALNNMNFIHSNSVEFPKWRKIILGSTRFIDDLYGHFGGKDNGA